jgi:hypothetical protein
LSFITWIIRPMFQAFLGVLSTRSTISPTFMFLFCFVHFWRACRIGKYSFRHLEEETQLRGRYVTANSYFLCFPVFWSGLYFHSLESDVSFP